MKTDAKVWKIGELTINAADDDDNNSQTVHDLKLQTIYFYQGSSYLGSDNAYVSTAHSKFTARVYLKSVNGFEGRVKFYVTNAQLSSKPLNSNMTETRTITLKPNSNGYIEVSLPTRYLSKGRYYMISSITMEVQHGFITQQMSFLSMSMPLSTNLTHLTYSATNQHLVQPLTLTPLHSMVNTSNQLVIKLMEKLSHWVLTRLPLVVQSCLFHRAL